MLRSQFFGSLIGVALIALAGPALTTGCTTEAQCFRNCGGPATVEGGDGNVPNGGKGGAINTAGSAVIGFGGDDIGTGNMPGVGGAVLEDAGTECDTVDLKTDVNNCGECGHHCIITGAEAVCVKGECQISRCSDHRYDINNDPSDGCELACDGEPSAEELCNGEDDNCNGVRDEGFDLTSDVDHCGTCENACNLLHAVAKCDSSVCKIDACEKDWYDIDGLASTGCEYQCKLKDKNGKECDPATAPVGDGCGVEVCDDIDQDCDGQINDGTADAGKDCSDFCPTADCKGTCTFGKTQCIGSALVCIPGVTPTAETCDGLDTNCDGIDDDTEFHVNDNAEHCGSCDVTCVGMVPNAIAKCQNKQCKVDVCKDGYGDYDPISPGCEACPVTPVRAESCNGKDDDCDGLIDEPAEVALTKPASGAAAGVNSYCKQKLGTLCNNVPLHCDSQAGGWVCDYPVGVETSNGKVAITESRCDGIDGNCDGQKDEAFLDLGKKCNDGALGVCLDEGKIVCNPNDVSKTTCDVTFPPDPPQPSMETCNGKDDDCNGLVDDGTDQMVRITRNSLDFYIDKYEASRPDATDKTVGTDESHLCGIPNRLPWTGATFDEAKAACEGSGKRLCKLAELEEACVGASNRLYPYGNAYVAGNCNGIDAPGSAAAPTGSFASCVSSDGVYDLSGNVAEWSSDVKGQTTGNPVYNIMALQGGSFLTPSNGLTCKFDFDAISTNAVLSSLGFRCCKNAP